VQYVVRTRRGETGFARVTLWSALAALGVSVVCWTPVVIDQITGHPGNLTAIVRFARDGKRPTLGLQAGIYQGVHSVLPPTVLGRRDTTGLYLLSTPGALRVVVCVVLVGALVAIAAATRRRAPAVARLALVALVVIAAGVVNGSNIPNSFESARINLYRWTWTAAFMAWAALGIGFAVLVARAYGRRPIARRARRLAPTAMVVVASLITASIVLVSGASDHNREVPEFALEKHFDAAVLAKIKQLDHHRPVLVLEIGADATLSIAPQLVFRLIEAGVNVEVAGLYTSTYGTQRQYRPSKDLLTIAVSSGKARPPAGPGVLLAYRHFGPERNPAFDRLSAERGALLDDLAAQVRGKKLVLAPAAKARIDHDYPGLAGYIIGLVVNHMAADPLTALGDPRILNLILDGIVRTPELDLSKVRQLLALPGAPDRGTYGDDQVEIHLLDPYEAAVCSLRPCFTPE
jgi:hypothetical protein